MTQQDLPRWPRRPKKIWLPSDLVPCPDLGGYQKETTAYLEQLLSDVNKHLLEAEPDQEFIFFISDKGDFGVSAQPVLVGDLICILDSCAPIVLRRSAGCWGDRTRWEIVSTPNVFKRTVQIHELRDHYPNAFRSQFESDFPYFRTDVTSLQLFSLYADSYHSKEK
jgi:hypothetical protein